MNTSFRISTAQINQLDSILLLGSKLQAEEVPSEPLLIYNHEESRAHYEAEISNPDALIIVATNDENTIVGYQYSYFHILDHLSSQNRECVLEALYVAPQYRGQGIAKALINYSENWAINDKGANRISTHIYSANKASINLHLKDGFEPYNTEYIKLV